MKLARPGSFAGLSLAESMLGRGAMEHRATGTRWNHVLGHGLAASAAFGALFALGGTIGAIALAALLSCWIMVDALVALAATVALGLMGTLLSTAPLALLGVLAVLGLGLSVVSHSVYRDLRSTHLPAPVGGRWLRELLEVLVGWPGHLLLVLTRHGYRPPLARAVETAGRELFAPAPNAHRKNWSGADRGPTRAIIYATSVDDVVAAVQQANREGCRLRVVGVGNSWLSLVPTDGIIVSTALLDSVELKLSDPNNPYAVVGSGATSRDLNRVLEPLGLAVTSSVVMETVSWGGMIGMSAHGSGCDEHSVCDLVETVQLVDSQGRVRTFHRYVHGDDVMSTVCGALGTCGVITSITLRVTRAGPVRYRDAWLPLDRVPTHMAALTLGHDYTDLYWFPGMDRVWIRTWDHAPNGPAMQAVPGWSGRSNRGHYGLWASSALLAMAPLKDLLSRCLPSPLARRVLAMQGNSAVGTLVDVCTHINNVTHCRGGIELDREGSVEFAVPVGEQFEYAIRAWETAVGSYKAWDARGCRPMTAGLNARFVRGSRCFLAPARGDDLHCDIQILGDLRHPAWEDFASEVAWSWMQLPKARPHWGKQLSWIPGLLAHLRRTLGSDLERFGMVRRVLELDQGGLFGDPFLEDLLAHGTPSSALGRREGASRSRCTGAAGPGRTAAPRTRRTG